MKLFLLYNFQKKNILKIIKSEISENKFSKKNEMIFSIFFKYIFFLKYEEKNIILKLKKNLTKI